MATDRSSVRPATLDDIRFLHDKLRRSDVLEIAASTGLKPGYVVYHSFQLSTHAWTGCYDDVPFVMFGVSSPSLISSVGCPWLVGTDDIESRGAVAVAKRSRQYVHVMREGFDLLENYTDDRHVSAHRWLEWCGFHIEEPRPWGVEGLPFRRFWIEGKNV